MVRDICDRHDVLLIADEVMTGFGRTGKAFATQHWDALPDIMCIAKGITSAYAPFGAVGLDEKVYAGLKGWRSPADLQWPPGRRRSGLQGDGDLRP